MEHAAQACSAGGRRPRRRPGGLCGAAGVRLAAVILACVAVAAAGAAEPAGKVLFASADAAVERAGAVSRLARGDAVQAGDVLVTATGRVQVRFSDGATVSVAPQSRFRIDDYAYGAGAERGFFSLLKGAIRAVTGAVGSTRREDYRVTTAVATIGIRGTAYAAQLCQGDCAAAGATRADGLYVNTSAGIVSLTNAAGTIDVPAGSAAYVPDPQTAPRLTDVAPAAQSAVPTPANEPEFRAGESMIGGGHHDDGGHHHVEP